MWLQIENQEERDGFACRLRPRHLLTTHGKTLTNLLMKRSEVADKRMCDITLDAARMQTVFSDRAKLEPISPSSGRGPMENFVGVEN